MSKRYQPRTEEQEPLSGVNIIPVIDVSLVLLIILLATSPILNLPGFEVKLPKALTAESKEKNLTISLSLKGEVAVNEAKSTMETVAGELSKQLNALPKSERKNMLVIIRADQGVSYGQVEQVMEEAKKGGATRIAIATQQDTEKLKQ
jgi:biopolymer transport protein ExbD